MKQEMQFWKEGFLAKMHEPDARKALQKDTQIVLGKIERLSCGQEDFERILLIAEKERVTFYDASYIYFAVENKLELATEDKERRAKAQKYVKTQNVTALLSL